MAPTSVSAPAALTYVRLGEERWPELVTKIKGIMAEGEAHAAAIFNADFWHWQYRQLPTGQARVYGVLTDDEIMGYYHVPIYHGWRRGAARRFAVVQEVAVSQRLRGRGVFRHLAEFATADLAASDIHAIYTFPNKRSIHTFLKYNGYTKLSTFAVYVLPVRSGRLLGSKLNLLGLEQVLGGGFDILHRGLFRRVPRGATVSLQAPSDPVVVEVFAAYQAEHNYALRRDEAYLKWRFEQRPASQHYSFALRENGQAQAAAIFKFDRILNNPALLLMDFACRPGQEAALLRLISYVSVNGARDLNREFNLILAAGNARFLPRLKQLGFLPVPEAANPRPLELLVKNFTEPAEAVLQPQHWHLTLADWDVF